MQTATLLTPTSHAKTISLVPEKLLTGAEALDLGIDRPFELVNGKIVYMDYTGDEHGFMESEISRHLGNFNVTCKLGWVLTGEVGLYTRYAPDTVRDVDVIFISRQRLSGPSGKALHAAPELVVEIVSPTDRWSELRSKIAEYFTMGVERVWIVEPEKRQLLVYRTPTEFTQLTEQETVRGEGILEGFVLPLSELFAELP